MRRMKSFGKKGIVFGLLVAVGLGLAGCGSGDSSAKKQDSEGMTVGVTSFADTLEPTDQYFGWVVSRYGVGETLVKFDEEGEAAPSLAEEWQVSDDHKTWTFKIREGVKFSNGTELTPEIAKASIQRSFERNPRAETFFVPESMTVDGQNLVIKTKTASAVVPGSLADPLFIIVDTTADTEKFATEGPICTGPYVVTKFNPTEDCDLVKNDDYWDGDVPLDKVTMKCIDDQATRSMALQNNEIQIAYNLKTENEAEFKNNQEIKIDKLDSLRSTYSFMNQNGPLKDIQLRQALIRSLDRESYANKLLKGGATPGKAPIPPTLDFGFDELKDENSYDPASAKKILAEAGYKDTDGDGFVESPTGEKIDLNFVIYTSREELNVYAQALQANAKEVGIKVTLNTVSYETLLDMRDAGSFDLLIWNVLVANTGDPENYLRENWYSTSPSNQAKYNNPEVDKLIDELTVTFDENKRRELCIKIQQLIMDDAATIFFGYETTYLFYNKDVKGARLYPIDYYWLTKDVAYQ